ncbi:MAG: hypothetical protein Q7U66_04455 [Methylobacter sp.]|nr:hypothetical protein [Methylobacter sp.]
MTNNQIAIFGEGLFDQFPGGQQILSGAPFNVAWQLQAFNRHPCFISRVGRDAKGDKIRQAMPAWGMAGHYNRPMERAQPFASALVTKWGATVQDLSVYRPFIDVRNLD